MFKSLMLSIFIGLTISFQLQAALETVDVSLTEKLEIAQQLEAAAQAESNQQNREQLLKISGLFRQSSGGSEVEVAAPSGDDCVNCEGAGRKAKGMLTQLGRFLGKGSSWLVTTTGKPFMAASAFLTGLIEKESKNKDLVAFYKFFLNHEKEYSELYLDADTPEELVESMLIRTEEIMEKKNDTIMRDFLGHLGIKDLPQDLSELELSPDQIANIDRSKFNPDFINNHPEFKELKPLLGEITAKDLNDIVTSGHFDRAITFDNLKSTLPQPHELIGTVVGQIYGPKLALGIVSKTLASTYGTAMLGAQIGTGVSTAVCLQSSTRSNFEKDKDLRDFCNYVVNRSAYQLGKSRAKGYVAGKNTRARIAKKLAERRERQAEKKRLQQEKKAAPELT